MLPQALRLPLTPNQKFTGTKTRLPSCLLISAPNSAIKPRLAVIIPKSAIKLATQRNRLKRQLHGIFFRHHSSLPVVDLLLIVQSPSTVLADFTTFLSTLK